jgi:predicted ATPase
MTNHFHIITGGPGSGKTSLIEALAAEGVQVMPEAGRAIIQDQVAIGGSALPWLDREAFAAQMLGWELRSYREAAGLPGPVFFDRGIPDIVGYFHVSGLAVPPHLLRAAELHPYHQQVFIAPHWPEIYEQDAERKQASDEAEATFQAMLKVYSQLGYELLPLPLAPVAERVQFVQSHVAGTFKN